LEQEMDMRVGTAWMVLGLAGVLETAWAVGLKYTQGFTRLWPSVGTGVAAVASMVLLAIAVKVIPVGTGYALWTGIGAVGTALIGMVWLGESRDVLRVLCLGLIIAGVLGLRFVSEH
jgi:quaternary ammonium compound-resistance protein SugE